MIKHSKTSVVSVLLAVVAIGMIVFDKLTSSQPISSHPLALEEAACLQGATDTHSTTPSFSIAKGNFPLQGLKAEEIKTDVTARLRSGNDLIAFALLFMGVERESFQPKALFYHAKPLGLAAPRYIFFRQILV